MLKFAPDGYPYILFLGVATLIIAFLAGPLFAFPTFLLTVFILYFFRDPERPIPDGDHLFVSAADGKVILIKDVYESEHLNEEMKEVSVFMSPFNVHVNRAPCDGKVKKITYTKGRYLAAYKDDASLKNENIAMVLETKFGDILVRQVAGFVARRAVCRKTEGDTLRRGERYGIIKFGSRLDIYLPKDVDIKVKLNDNIKAGVTILAEIRY
jgi:phosphatidylserine decarboxylase